MKAWVGRRASTLKHQEEAEEVGRSVAAEEHHQQEEGVVQNRRHTAESTH